MSKYDYYGNDRKISVFNKIIIIIAAVSLICAGVLSVSSLKASTSDSSLSVEQTIQQLDNENE
ncbi:hypothetical protein SAMN05216249_102155 [Acetitomaculum ruminis DSM 5522]|uniref:Uncharacterized protein n=1 Tax=Acetitomaculum ruminis DSM 5522 TaxID=1120918 RepID=A0A1I0VTD4_9FIRM|nr:hypothetical protein [Acetitomaculum ruminis]SFA78946.1 hypothetical protein SAMN05216249_102155 [Acetitomaculum ruminis DSM 5522]